jgi:plasmid maintenance system antidote protein VapI
MSTSVGPTAEDLRAEIARRRVVVYRLASLIAIHPSRLSLYLNGHLPLSPELGFRILEALQSADLTKPR